MRWWRERRRQRREQQEQAERRAWLNGVLMRAREGEGRTINEILRAASAAMDREADERNRRVQRCGCGSCPRLDACRGSVVREGPIFGWYGP